jgi:hypothetical protein
MAMSDAGRYKDLVFDLLSEYRILRDDVNLLYLACVMSIRGKEYINNTTLKDHFKNNINNPELKKIPSMASVIRLNTKLQKENPNLRGKDWEKKQKHSKDYKEDLGYHV